MIIKSNMIFFFRSKHTDSDPKKNVNEIISNFSSKIYFYTSISREKQIFQVESENSTKMLLLPDRSK